MIEKKSLLGKLEVKFAASDADKASSVSGYGAVFGNVDSYGDIIQPGAFTKSIASKAKPAMLLNHDFRSIPIGLWSDVSEDAVGLKVSGTFLETTAGADAYTAAKAGAITGLSIGYVVTDSEVKGNNRIIKEVDLIEVSLVTFPANDQARIADVKSTPDGSLIAIMEAVAELKAKVEVLSSQLVEMKGDGEEGDECDDDEDCDEDCTCNEDGECEEEKSEYKYDATVLAAVKNLTLKLKQESHG